MKDLLVIGVGMAGNTAALKCASAGWDVAVVDELPYGGTCALRGCDPKKMLRRGAEIIDGAALMRGKGIDRGGLSINWADLMAHKRSFTHNVPGKMETGLQKAGVQTLHGPARFVNENAVEVGDHGRVEARHILIAAGARPRPLDMPGAELMADSTDFLDLDTLPPRIVFVGGGYVSFEFAHIAARAGATVTILDRGKRPLKDFDPDMVDILLDRTGTLGIDVLQETELVSVARAGGAFVVSALRGQQPLAIDCDLVVHGAGRVPAIDHLDLEAAGIASSVRGVTVHPHLQSTTNSRVYAAGDAAASPGQPLTPVAVFEGKVAASNMVKGGARAPDYAGVPSAVFTIPEVVRVGLLQAEAAGQGLDFRVTQTDTSGWFSNRRIGETHAGAKMLVENSTDRILGAHMCGPEYAELINLVGLAIRLKLTARDLKSMVSAYPTVGSDLGALLG